MTFYELFAETIKKCEPKCGYSDARYEFASHVKEILRELNSSFKSTVYVNCPCTKGDDINIVVYSNGVRTLICYLKVKFKKAGEANSKYSYYFSSGPSTLYIPVAATTCNEELMSEDIEDYIFKRIGENPETIRVAEVQKKIEEIKTATEGLRTEIRPLVEKAVAILAPYKAEYTRVYNECYGNNRNFNTPEYKSAFELYKGIMELFKEVGINVNPY